MQAMDCSLEHARGLDAADPLAGFRSRFYLPPGLIYFDGNSLGPLSMDAEASVLRVLSEWKTLSIGGWLEGSPPWFTLAEKLAGAVASVVGAQPGEVAVANSTTVNLHQLLATLYRPAVAADGRTKILMFGGEFPSDLYAAQSHLRLRGLDPAAHLLLLPPDANGLLDEEKAARILRDDSSLQMAVLPAVVYTTGQLLDVATLTATARRGGVAIGFDLSHSIGVVPHALTAAGVDFAFWCHYKYLNAGPGALGGLYLNRRHFDRPPGLAGWWGSHKESMFDMARELRAAGDAGALQIGTPPVLSLAALEGALALSLEAGMTRIRAKSLGLTRYLMDLIGACLPGVETGEISIRHPASGGPTGWACGGGSPGSRTRVSRAPGRRSGHGLPSAADHQARARAVVQHVRGMPRCGGATPPRSGGARVRAVSA